MGSLSSSDLEYARCLCLDRDGYNCKGCGKSLDQLKHVVNVHHVDGNNRNNPKDGSNWELRCGSCNVKQWWVEKRVSAIEGRDETPFQYSVSSKMELAWIRWMIDEIVQHKKISWSKAINTGALEINGQDVTTKRYLKKHVEDSDHPKAIFKAKTDKFFNTYITFSDHAESYFLGQQ